MVKTGIVPAKIMLPAVSDMTAWACVACDQFTSEPEYWTQLEKQVSGKPSALSLVLPEIYLGSGQSEKIAAINRNMENYLAGGIFRTLPEGFILTVRSTPYVKRRIGLVGAVDLEEYDYAKNSSALVRATEGTIEERIPPRLEIRKNAPMEFSHIMVLFDDEKREITERLYEERNRFEKLYDFDLNMNGGHIEGYFIPADTGVQQRFSALLDEERLIKKYGKADKFAFAVGDGNHSLATAKAHWNRIKEGLPQSERANHPARYALAEFVNIYDEGIYFEPIYRLVTGVNARDFAEGLKKAQGCFEILLYGDKIKVSGGGDLPASISAADGYIEKYIRAHGGAVDYIHGEENLAALIKGGTAAGVIFEKLDKSKLFKYVSDHGALPRKTFSMGEGVEKRYYLEGRRITND